MILTSITMAVTKKPCVGENVEESEPLGSVGRTANWFNTMEKRMEIPQEN